MRLDSPHDLTTGNALPLTTNNYQEGICMKKLFNKFLDFLMKWADRNHDIEVYNEVMKMKNDFNNQQRGNQNDPQL